MKFRRSIALAVAALTMLVLAPAAFADTTDIIQPQNGTSDQGFQAITCTENREGEVAPGKFCSVETPGLYSLIAGGHPKRGFTQYIIEHQPFAPLPSPPFPAGSLTAELAEPINEHTIRILRTDLPPGLTVNPEATASRCDVATEFLNKVGENYVPTCKAETITGEQEITLVTNKDEVEIQPGFKPPKGFVIPPTPGGTKIPIYNLTHAPGEPAKLGFIVNGKIPVFLETEVAWESDFHESFTIKLPNTAEVTGLSTLISRLVSKGQETGNGTYLTNPTTCFNPNEPQFSHLYSTWFRANNYAEGPPPAFPSPYTAVEATAPPLTKGGALATQTGCDTIPFEPSITSTVTTGEVDSSTGGTVVTKLPFDPAKEGGTAQSQSHLRKATVTLPAGMGLNPSGSKNLAACTDAQFQKGQRTYANACPANSVIGTAEVTSPPLAEPLLGNIYVGEQKSNNPESGEQFRILIEAKNEKEGINLRLVGNVKANKETGQLTAVLTDKLTGPLAGPLPEGLPQVPFEEVKLSIGADKQVLTTPPTCGSQETTGQMEPWARPGTTAPVSAKYQLTSVPGGGACPTTLAARKFTPTYSAKSDNAAAGAYSPFKVQIARADGEQELKVVNVTLPKGLTGNLKGIPYCSDAALAAAANTSGAAQKASPSCSAASQIGVATTRSGTGPSPLSLGGAAYLAGPYKGAPLSLAVITPAISGPFDLGTVVVRVALNVNPETAQINAVSDLIPNVYGGVKLDIRGIDVDVNRAKFMKNPTNCAAASTAGTLSGGGSNPLDPAAFSSYAVSSPYQATGCNKLKFGPKLHVRLKGPTKRAKFPQLRAVLEARNNDANIQRTALTLPPSLFLEQGHIGTVCTRVQLAAQNCPKGSIYGKAEAKTPLLDQKLKGNVYLVSSNHELPDLLADLRGQVPIQLRGVISSKRGGLKTVFNNLPDVPVTKFILNMSGGKKSLLVNSENTCRKKQQAVLNIKGQNGKKVVNNKFGLNIASCNGKKKGGKKQGGNKNGGKKQGDK